jgi:murein DD-endopeptidase MepM/ murein hydrolase activator NlpD
MQRALSDEPSLDQSLVAQVMVAAPAPAPTPTPAQAVAGAAAAPAVAGAAAEASKAGQASKPGDAARSGEAARQAEASQHDDAEHDQAAHHDGAPTQTEVEYQMAMLPVLPIKPIFAPAWPTNGLITTYFGEVGEYSPRGHAGLDIAADTGTPILAADEGEVVEAYWNEVGYGGLIVVEHPSGYQTWYGHLSRIGVEAGEHVARGQQIGRMGSTGYSTGPHLHFEVRQDGQLRNPLSFLAESGLKSH